ncbi:MAG: RluA family pseudouridine synthase [Desulfobulbus sp.]|nr:RluA family pseudouridine synthase [Desulfobulbus sp.]
MQLEIEVLYQDQDLVVVNKPGGLLAVPGRGPDKQDCVTARVRRLIPECIAQPAVHRLDMDTSGLMVLGLTVESHRHLSGQFAERRVAKRYLALLTGKVMEEAGEIQLRFRLDPQNRPYQVYDPVQGKLGITQWQRRTVVAGQSLIEFTPLTGRTHQLRLHAAHPLGLGHPIVGDRLYGSGQRGDTLCLHAAWLQFFHPASGALMRFSSIAPFLNNQFDFFRKK